MVLDTGLTLLDMVIMLVLDTLPLDTDVALDMVTDTASMDNYVGESTGLPFPQSTQR